MKEQDLHNENDTFLAQWLAGELSDNELKALVSESDFKAYLKIRKGIDAYEVLGTPTAASFEKIKAHISHKESKVKPLHAKTWLIGIAASVVLFFGLFTILGDDIVTIETNFGEQRTIALLDGSEVILNSKSTLTYDEDNWASERTLNLKGEAYFKVKKGSAFTVITENGKVKVLGTQFNVNTINELLEVVCFEGQVSVHSKGEAHVLLPSKSFRRINGHTAELWDVIESRPTWLDGESSFKSLPLHYVISALEAQYDITINASAIDQHIIYTGSFTHKDLDTALKTVFKSLQIRYIEKENRNIYLSSK